MKNQLFTNRLLLRPFYLRDAQRFHDLCSDPEVMHYIGDASIPTLNDIKQSLTRWIRHFDTYGYSLMALINLKTDELMGFCGLIRQEINNEIKVELGYRLGKDYWHQGFASEAALLMKNHAFNDLDLKSLISIIQSGNIASQKIAEKLGMVIIQKCEYHHQPVFIYMIEK